MLGFVLWGHTEEANHSVGVGWVEFAWRMIPALRPKDVQELEGSEGAGEDFLGR